MSCWQFHDIAAAITYRTHIELAFMLTVCLQVVMFAGIHADTIPRPWSEEECRVFESGIRM